ncbi:4'-phosphopantetheinyl transferase superfamily protein [Kiritimatiellaeota bacterium B1221]|nr:4'-phosphopantetheinyl transferase superfamily protein [Kiritimatiellaeota bacterium B1221]
MIPGFPELELDEIRASLSAGDLLSFVFPLETPQKYFRPYATRLSEDEKQRIHRFKHSKDAQAYSMGRIFIRSILEGFLGERPLKIALTEHGKPYCPLPHSPRFNLSHGGGWLLVSFSQSTWVGVDLEDLRREVRAKALANRYFSPAEQAMFTRGGDAGSFMNIWTRKEARLKASGEGLTVPISERCTLTESGWQYEAVKADRYVQGVVAYPGDKRIHRVFRRSVSDFSS